MSNIVDGLPAPKAIFTARWAVSGAMAVPGRRAS